MLSGENASPPQSDFGAWREGDVRGADRPESDQEARSYGRRGKTTPNQKAIDDWMGRETRLIKDNWDKRKLALSLSGGFPVTADLGSVTLGLRESSCKFVFSCPL